MVGAIVGAVVVGQVGSIKGGKVWWTSRALEGKQMVGGNGKEGKEICCETHDRESETMGQEESWKVSIIPMIGSSLLIDF